MGPNLQAEFVRDNHTMCRRIEASPRTEPPRTTGFTGHGSRSPASNTHAGDGKAAGQPATPMEADKEPGCQLCGTASDRCCYCSTCRVGVEEEEGFSSPIRLQSDGGSG